MENIEQQFNRAVELLKENADDKIAKGEKILSELIEKFPEFLPARLEYADLQIEAGLPFEALDLLKQGLKFSRDDFRLRYMLGIARQKCWLLTGSENDFLQLKEQAPEDVEILRQLGWVKILKGQIKEGRDLVRQSLSGELMNPYPYMDLGVSYVGSLEFEEGLKWLETGRNLKPDDSVILEKIRWAKQIQKQFAKFSDKDRKKMKEMRQDPAELKLAAVQSMLFTARDCKISKDSYQEIQKEIKLAGFNPKMMEFDAPKTKNGKIVREYMEYHRKVEDVERKISKKEFEDIKYKLLNLKINEQEFKKCLIVLAHQGTKEAIKLLNEFLRKAPPGLKDWANLALKECEMLSTAKPGQVAQIFH